MNKQTIYIPTKVEEELPDILKSVVTISNIDKLSVHQRVDAEVYKNDLNTLKELHDKNGFLNFGDDSFVKKWLKLTEAYVFTPEELKQLLSDAFDAGTKYGDVNCEFGGETRLPNKQDYIKNFLNKEK